MTTSLETLTMENVKDAVKKSLGLEPDEYISADTPLIILNPNVEPTDLLEIFQKAGISPIELKSYITDGGLTKLGKTTLRQAAKGLTSRPSIRLYDLANTKSLDEFTQQICSTDIYRLAIYKPDE